MAAPAQIISGFNRVILFLLLFLTFSIVAGIGLVFQHGYEALLDYGAYVAPVFAGVAGGARHLLCRLGKGVILDIRDFAIRWLGFLPF